ncbi:Acyltransferase [Azospirillum doebereinerae]
MRKKLDSLTSLRFFAAFAIVIHHVKDYFLIGKDLSLYFSLDMGVSFFFVLSGFILFYSYESMEKKRSFAKFLVARIARIWPIHLVLLMITIIFFSYPWGYPGEDMMMVALSNLFLLHSWIPLPDHFFSFNAVSWSISTELFFYIMFPFLIDKWSRTWWWKMALVAALTLGMVLLTEQMAVPFLSAPGSYVTIDALVYISPLARLLEFATGMAVASLWLKARCRLGAEFESIHPALATFLETAALLAAVWATYQVPQWVVALRQMGALEMGTVKWLLGSGCMLVFGILIFILGMQRGLVSRLLSLKPLVFLGEISFSIYMTHQIVFRTTMEHGSLAVFGDLTTQYVVYWVYVLLLSSVLWAAVEKPCRAYIVSAFRKHFDESPTQRVSVPVIKGGGTSPSPGLAGDGMVARANARSSG